MPSPPPAIQGDIVRLRPLAETDRAALTVILAEPSVARWWAPRGATAAAEDLFDPEEVTFAIEVDGRVAGAIAFYEEDDPDYRHAAIDLFLAEEWQGRGMGPDAIRAVARYLFDVRGHHRLTIDPALANERAIRAYEKVGFRRVGVMRSYERGADGTWHDGLLMDLLAGELR